MKYHHLGIPTTTAREGEYYLEAADLHVYDYRHSPFGVEWVRFGPGNSSPELVRTVPHVAFEVDDLDAALAGKDVIIPPSSPSDGVRVAFIADNGAPVELLEYEVAAPAADAGPAGGAEDVAGAVLALERAALERWGRGDPGGFIDLAAEDIVYFDPFQERRVDGREAFVRLMESICGQVRVERFELTNPAVHASGDLALLTFNFLSQPDGPMSRWNASEAYRRDVQGWRLVHQHWSLTRQPG
ncbi:MAG TPA: nuclear transport factor 2 family protein [Vicinamibacterales bacterium]|nr:nuclear transport factor 2 family protein [Vicinamibacterales bacterium]